MESSIALVLPLERVPDRLMSRRDTRAGFLCPAPDVGTGQG